MHTVVDDSTTGQPGSSLHCQRCGALLEGDAHHHANLQVCEACYIDTWRPHHRKSHWCYLRSIKSDYLVPPSSD
jgi:hypothetical protein